MGKTEEVTATLVELRKGKQDLFIDSLIPSFDW